MSSLFIILAVLLVLSFVPLLFLIVRGYLRFRGARVVTCPNNGQTVKVRLDAARAALSSLSDGVDLKVTSCERWPEQKDCRQACVDESAPLPRPLATAGN